MSFYRLTSTDELPLVMVLDPITGAKQHQLSGFIEPQRCAARRGGDVGGHGFYLGLPLIEWEQE